MKKFCFITIVFISSFIFPQFEEKIEVHLISLYVNVLDKKGNQIEGLKKEDFEVLEDGKPQKITHFMEVRNLYPVEESAYLPEIAEEKKEKNKTVAKVKEDLKEKYIIYVDNLNINPIQRNSMLDKLENFIKERMKGDAEVMVVSYSRTLKVHNPFTKEYEIVKKSIDEIREYTGEAMQRIDAKNDLLMDIEEVDSYDLVIGRINNFAREIQHETNLTIKMLEDFILYLSAIPGKKSLIYLSSGLPKIPALELYHYLHSRFTEKDPLMYTLTLDLTPNYKSVINTANTAGVSLFMVDVSGLRALSESLSAESKNLTSYSIDSSLETNNLTDPLVLLSEETGGVPIVNTNDFKKGFEKISKVVENYYFIGYQRPWALEDRIHNIQVKVKAKKAYTVSYRKGFKEKSLITEAQDVLISSLYYPQQKNPYGISLKFFQPKKLNEDTFSLPFELSIPFPSIYLIEKENIMTGDINIGFVSMDSTGQRSDVTWIEHPFNIPKNAYEKLKDQIFKYKAELAIKGGFSRVSCAVVNKTDNTISVISENVMIDIGGKK
jgi:VWFA-related protein